MPSYAVLPEGFHPVIPGRRAQRFRDPAPPERVLPPTPAQLDGRSPEEYRGERVGAGGGPDVGAMCYGRIPGARHLFFDNLLNADKSLKSREELKSVVNACGAEPGKDIVVYCRLSHRATVLALALTQRLGFDHVKVYDGSCTEWGNVVGLPIERGPRARKQPCGAQSLRQKQ